MEKLGTPEDRFFNTVLDMENLKTRIENRTKAFEDMKKDYNCLKEKKCVFQYQAMYFYNNMLKKNFNEIETFGLYKIFNELLFFKIDLNG